MCADRVSIEIRSFFCALAHSPTVIFIQNRLTENVNFFKNIFLLPPFRVDEAGESSKKCTTNKPDRPTERTHNILFAFYTIWYYRPHFPYVPIYLGTYLLTDLTNYYGFFCFYMALTQLQNTRKSFEA